MFKMSNLNKITLKMNVMLKITGPIIGLQFQFCFRTSNIFFPNISHRPYVELHFCLISNSDNLFILFSFSSVNSLTISLYSVNRIFNPIKFNWPTRPILISCICICICYTSKAPFGYHAVVKRCAG